VEMEASSIGVATSENEGEAESTILPGKSRKKRKGTVIQSPGMETRKKGSRG